MFGAASSADETSEGYARFAPSVYVEVFDADYLVELNAGCTVRVFGQNYALEVAIGSHACLLEANVRVTNGIPLESPLLLSLPS